jgi:outer membrane protein assembly factor BamB
VRGDRVWLTTAKEDGSSLYVLGLDLNSGAVVHDIEVFQPNEPQRIHSTNTYATPSITVEEGRVYAHFGTFGTACLDSDTGKVLWRRTDLNCDHLQGPVASPVLFDDLLILHLEGIDIQFIAALDKHTGKTVWLEHRAKELYETFENVFLLKGYITPVVIEVDGKAQLVSNGALLVSGHELRTGKELWRVEYRDDSAISRIVSGGGLLFVNTGGDPTSAQLFAVRQGGVGNVTESHVVWKMTEDVPLASSPVLVDDLLYTVSDRGVLKCTEANTGKAVWVERLDGDYGASLLYADNRIYISNKNGKTTVIEPGRTFRTLATNQLDGGLFASPAVDDTSLLLRTKTHLYRIQGK